MRKRPLSRTPLFFILVITILGLAGFWISLFRDKYSLSIIPSALLYFGMCFFLAIFIAASENPRRFDEYFRSIIRAVASLISSFPLPDKGTFKHVNSLGNILKYFFPKKVRNRIFTPEIEDIKQDILEGQKQCFSLLAKTTFNMAIYSRVIITFFQAIVVWLFSSFEDLINVVKVFKK